MGDLDTSATARHVARQLTRAGTSGGANYEEARGAESRADFAHKILVSAKAVRESSGDEGLRAVTITLAGILTRSTRQVDVRAALGDVRFGLILPETPMEGALVLAERIRVAVEQHAFILPDRPSPLARTVSIGLAGFPRDAEDDRGLLARLHDALARARGGGNTTVTAVSAPNS